MQVTVEFSTIWVDANVPEQLPVQPENVEPEAGTAVSVTLLPLAKLAEQVAPHEIPDGLDDTTPLPVPAGLTNKLTLLTAADENVATQLAFVASTRLVLAAVPAQLPDQPEKTEPAAGVAVNVAAVFAANVAEQVVPQLIPAGADAIVPEPVPALLTASVA